MAANDEDEAMLLGYGFSTRSSGALADAGRARHSGAHGVWCAMYARPSARMMMPMMTVAMFGSITTLLQPLSCALRLLPMGRRCR
jgi:hypothetical protein